jgi:predicted CoA-binding protein
MKFENPDENIIFDYLREAKRIAVVGMSDNSERTSYLIADILKKEGYDVVAVNPKLAGTVVNGIQVYGKLQDIPGHIDLVDIFRRSEFLPDVARDFLETDADVFWAQQGLVSDEAAEILRNAGRDKIVMDRCSKIEVNRMRWADSHK